MSIALIFTQFAVFWTLVDLGLNNFFIIVIIIIIIIIINININIIIVVVVSFLASLLQNPSIGKEGCQSFDELGLSKDIIDAAERMHIVTPTSVQVG